MREPLWAPSAESCSRANITRFRELVNQRYGGNLKGYADLYAWSIDRMADFWEAAAEFTGVRFSTPHTSVVDDPARMPGARWFQGARLNFAENLLRFRDDRPALIFRREDGLRRTATGAELYDHQTDPQEMINLANRSEQAEVVEQLSAMLRERIADNQRPPEGVRQFRGQIARQ